MRRELKLYNQDYQITPETERAKKVVANVTSADGNQFEARGGKISANELLKFAVGAQFIVCGENKTNPKLGNVTVKVFYDYETG